MDKVEIGKELLQETKNSVNSILQITDNRLELLHKFVEDSNSVANDLESIKTITEKLEKCSSSMRILALNTEIEAARINYAPVSIIGKEMKTLSTSYVEFSKDINALANDIFNKVNNLLQILNNSKNDSLNSKMVLNDIAKKIDNLTN